MSYETEVAALTVAVNTVSSLVTTLDTTTKSAYNVAVATAQTHAGTALTHANTAATQVGLSTTQASTATTQAGIATTKAGEASTSAATASAAATSATNSNNTATMQATSAANSAATATTQAGTATTQASLATTQAGIAAAQATAAAASALVADAILWVSGTTYAIGNARYSPTNGQTYRRLTAGAGTTDPASDTTNWVIVNGITSQAISILTNNLPAIRPSLDLDFANGQTVDPRITFTRASTATRTNARGLIEAVASGVPRIDFDPVTGACKGLLIEEQRTNLLTYSEQFDNAAWTKTRATVTPNATTAPDGLLTAEKLVEDTTASLTHVVYPGAYVATNVTLTASCYAKAGERTRILMEISNFSTGAATCVFDLAAGTAGSPGNGGDYTGTTAVIAPVGGGWYRLSITASKGAFNASNHVSLSLHNGTSATYTGDGTSGLFIWGAQLEAGAFPTSYIPTVASQVTRAADVATMTGANFSSWYRSDEGSFVAIASAAFDSSTSLFPTHLSVNDGTTSNRIVVGQRTIDDTVIGTIVNGGTTQTDFSATSSAVYGTQNNIALSYKVNDAAIARSGVLSQTDVSLTVPTVNQMNIGTNAGTSALNGHIRSISYYNRRLTNAELQALSTQ